MLAMMASIFEKVKNVESQESEYDERFTTWLMCSRLDEGLPTHRAMSMEFIYLTMTMVRLVLALRSWKYYKYYTQWLPSSVGAEGISTTVGGDQECHTNIHTKLMSPHVRTHLDDVPRGSEMRHDQ